MKRFPVVMLILLFAAAASAAQEQAAPLTATTVVVRGAANDGKLLDDLVGGVRVRITDARTGKLLATGIQHGNSGDTKAIMVEPRRRGAPIFDTPGAAAFTARLALARPTLVRITASGPLKYPQSVRTTEKVMLVIPGRDVTGEGVVLQLNGLIVHVLDLAPAPMPDGYKVAVTAHVAMMCGCPTTPGGIWDSNTMEIAAQAWHNGRLVGSARMSYAGQPDTYIATLEGLPPGHYTVRVLASTATHVNAGRDDRPLTITPSTPID